MSEKDEKKGLFAMESPLLDMDDMVNRLGKPGSFIKEVISPTKKNPRFFQDRFLLGKGPKGEIWLPANEAFHSLITGATRCGKSWLSERILSTCYKGENKVCVLTDIKNEFHVMKRPIQAKFAHNLAKDETPTGFPIRVYRPQFLIKNDGFTPKDNIPAQISFQDCTYSDLVMFLRLEKNENLRGLLDLVFDQIKDGEITDYREFEDAVMELKVPASMKRTFISRMESLKIFEVLGNDHPFSFIKDINAGYIPILNMSGFEEMGRDFSSFPQAYIAVVLRSLIAAKRRKLFEGKLFVFVDELPRFCPEKGEPTSKKEILEVLDVGAGLGLCLIMSTQDVVDIPQQVLNQSRFTFIPGNASRPLIEGVMKNKGIWQSMRPTFINEMSNSFKRMRLFEWGMVDDRRIQEVHEYDPLESVTIFRSYSPLCMHKETEGKKR